LYKPPYDDAGEPQVGGLLGISDHPRLVQYLWKLDVIDEEEASRMAPLLERRDEPTPTLPTRSAAPDGDSTRDAVDGSRASTRPERVGGASGTEGAS
jgi:hypothetical protein